MAFAEASSEATSARAARPARWRRRAWIVVAVLTPALLLRGCVLSTFVIRSPSMEPALRTGDHLLALRAGVDPRELARFDVVILDDQVDREIPPDVEAVVKRLVGLPGEFVELRHGDLYVGPTRDDLRLVRKPDDLVAALLVPVHAGAGLTSPWSPIDGRQAEPLAAGGTRLRGDGGRAVAAFGRAVLDGMLDVPGEASVADTALEVSVGAGDGQLLLQLREGADTFTARLSAAARGGGADIQHNLGGGGVVADPAFPGLEPGQTVLFWNVDNSVRLRVDGETVLAYDYDQNAPQTPGATFHNPPTLIVEDGSLELRRVVVLRDLHYGGQGTYGTRPGGGLTPARLPAGQIFVLGDLSHRSRDSRHFGPIPLEHLLGRPLAIYRPWARARWMDPDGSSP